MTTVWKWIVGFLQWFWSLLSLPFTFDECVKLLKEVNEKLDSPSKYQAELNWAKQIFDLKIKQAEEEKNKFAASDSKKKEELIRLIVELNEAQKQVQELIDLNQEIVENRDLFKGAFKAVKEKNERLTKMLVESRPILPPLQSPLGSMLHPQVLGSSSLADALFQSDLQKVRAAALAGAVPSALTEALAQRTIKAKESEE